MKNFFNRIIALIVAIASLLTVFSVFSFAETAPETEMTEEEKNLANFSPDDDILYNRTFDDGWEAANGFTVSKGISSIDYEVGSDGNYNYFMRTQHSGEASSYTLKFPANRVREGAAVVRFSIMADDLCDLGKVFSFKPYGTDSMPLLYIKGYDLYAFADNDTAGYNIGSLSDGDWYDLEFVFKWNDLQNIGGASKAPIYLYVNGEMIGKAAYVDKDSRGIENVAFSLPGTAEKEGYGFCIDNLLIYQSVNITNRIDVDEKDVVGNLVDIERPKTVPIYKNADELTPEKVISDALYMKLGLTTAYARGSKITNLPCAPVMIDNEVMVSLDAVLEYLGYDKNIHPDKISYEIVSEAGTTYITVGRLEASVSGETVTLSVVPGMIEGNAVISISDIATLFPGMDAMYDDMGLIVIYKKISDEAPLNRADDLDTMLDIMKKFVFEIEDGKKEENYTATGKTVVDKVADAIHPYIITNQANFNSLNKAYEGEKSVLKDYLDVLLLPAEKILKDMAEVDGAGKYVGIKDGKVPVNVYDDGKNPDDTNKNVVADTPAGYNSSNNRLYEIEYASANLVELAFAYQVTRNPIYADLAYDIMLALGEWNHWGPGYMANCATAAGNYAIAYDWLYNYVNDNKGEGAVEKLAYILYDKAIRHGVASSKGSFCQFPSPIDSGDKYTDRTDSYNAICSSGMIMASLAIANENIFFSDNATTQANSLAEARQNIKYLIGNNLRNLADYGLDQYAPDGAYIESITYWALGTNAFMKLIMSLESAAGDDFGFKKTWGIDKTFYFACYISNGNDEAWKYHEDAMGSLVKADVLTADTQMFNFAGMMLGDNRLIAIRKNQIEGGKTLSIFDVLFYYDGELDVDTKLDLDKYLQGIDGFVSRSGWEKDDMFVGMMGGMNNYYNYAGQSYGQVDSGNFIYENCGVKWIVDLGSDDIFADGYFGEYRWKNYRNVGEGHNMFLSSDVKDGSGQNYQSGGRMYDTYVDPDGKGSYAIIDNGDAYLSGVEGAKRGMLVTNDRKTVVIQDEVSFGRTTGNALWVVNTYEKITLDETKQVAYFEHKDGDSTIYLRATIVTTGNGVQFATKTYKQENFFPSNTDNSYTENPVGEINRLYIKTNTIRFDVAVVFEIVDSTKSDLEVGYEWTILDAWDTYFMDTEEGEYVETFDSLSSSFKPAINYASVIYDEYTHFTLEIDEFYKRLSHAFYILVENGVLDAVDDDNFLDEYDYKAQGGYDPLVSEPENYEEFVKFRNEYTEYISIVGKTTTDINLFTKILAGQT